MCRFTALISATEPVLIADIVTKPKLSIIYQSFNCHERQPRDHPKWAYEKSTLNGDGFGVGWYAPRADRKFIEQPDQPCAFTSLKPAWSDRNLAQVAENTVSPLIFAHVRAAGPGSGVPTELNCHPFKFGRFLFMHNGVVGQWQRVRKLLLDMLRTETAYNFALANSPIDSVVLCAHFIDQLDRGVDAEYSANELKIKFEQTLQIVCGVLDSARVDDVTYINCALTDGKNIVACRFALGPVLKRKLVIDSEYSEDTCQASKAESPYAYIERDTTQSLSLYFATGTQWSRFGDDHRMVHRDKRNEVCIITSEPLTDKPEEWVPVPHNHIVVVTSRIDVLLQPLQRVAQSQSPGMCIFAHLLAAAPDLEPLFRLQASGGSASETRPGGVSMPDQRRRASDSEYTTPFSGAIRAHSIQIAGMFKPVLRSQATAISKSLTMLDTETFADRSSVSTDETTSSHSASPSRQAAQTRAGRPSELPVISEADDAAGVVLSAPVGGALQEDSSREPPAAPEAVLKSMETFGILVDQSRVPSFPTETSSEKPSLMTDQREMDSIGSQTRTASSPCKHLLVSPEGEPVLSVVQFDWQGIQGNLETWLLTGGQRGIIRVWNTTTNVLVGTLMAHEGGVLAMALHRQHRQGSNSGRPHLWLFSGGADTTVTVCDLSGFLESLSKEASHFKDDSSCERNGQQFLKVKFSFEPRQGDVLSLAVHNTWKRLSRLNREGSKNKDYLLIGYQSTLMGYLDIASLLRRLERCSHLTGHKTTLCGENCGPHCPLSQSSKRINGIPRIVLSPSTQPSWTEGEIYHHPGTIFQETGQLQAILKGTTHYTTTSIGKGAATMAYPHSFDNTDDFMHGLPAQQSKEDSESVTTADGDSPKSSDDLRSHLPVAKEGDIAISSPHAHKCPCSIEWSILKPQQSLQHHCGFIQSIACTGEYLFSGGGDGMILVWEHLKHLKTMQGHKGGILCLAVEGDTLYSGSRDFCVKAWDLQTFTCKHTFTHHRSEVLSVCATPQFLFTGGANGEIFGWFRKSNEMVVRFFDAVVPIRHAQSRMTYERNAFCVTGLCAVTELTESGTSLIRLFGAGGDGTVRIWEFTEEVREGQQELEKTYTKDLIPGAQAQQTTEHHIVGGTQLVMFVEDNQLKSAMILVGSGGGATESTPVSFVTEQVSPVHEEVLQAEEIQTRTVAGFRIGRKTGHHRNILQLMQTEPGSRKLGEELWRALVRFQSISGIPCLLEECWQAARFLAEIFGKMGAQTKVMNIRPDAAPIVTAKLGEDPTKPTVLLYSHYDVVSSGDSFECDPFQRTSCQSPTQRRTSSTGEEAKSFWSTHPFELHGKNGYMYGRGASDNKGPLIVQIQAVLQLLKGAYNVTEYETLLDHGKTYAGQAVTPKKSTLQVDNLPVNVIFVCEGDEESGSRGFDRFIDEARELLENVTYAIFTNSYWLDDSRPCLVYGMRGLLDLSVTVTGSEDSLGLHSGIHGGAVVEPLQDLLGTLACLVDAQGIVQVPDFYRDVALCQSGEGAAQSTSAPTLDRLQSPASTDAKIRRDSVIGHFDLSAYRRETRNAGLRAGTALDILQKRWNEPVVSIAEVFTSTQKAPGLIGTNFRIMPSTASANISLRLVPDQQPRQIADELSKYLVAKFAERASPNRLNIDVLKLHKWWRGDTDSVIFESAAKALTSVWGVEPLFIREGGTIPIIHLVQAKLNANTIQIPIGQSTDNAHVPNERLRIINFLNGIEVLKRTLWLVGAMEKR